MFVTVHHYSVEQLGEATSRAVCMFICMCSWAGNLCLPCLPPYCSSSSSKNLRYFYNLSNLYLVFFTNVFFINFTTLDTHIHIIHRCIHLLYIHCLSIHYNISLRSTTYTHVSLSPSTQHPVDLSLIFSSVSSTSSSTTAIFFHFFIIYIIYVIIFLYDFFCCYFSLRHFVLVHLLYLWQRRPFFVSRNFAYLLLPPHTAANCLRFRGFTCFAVHACVWCSSYAPCLASSSSLPNFNFYISAPTHPQNLSHRRFHSDYVLLCAYVCVCLLFVWHFAFWP